MGKGGEGGQESRGRGRGKRGEVVKGARTGEKRGQREGWREEEVEEIETGEGKRGRGLEGGQREEGRARSQEVVCR